MLISTCDGSCAVTHSAAVPSESFMGLVCCRGKRCFVQRNVLHRSATAGVIMTTSTMAVQCEDEEGGARP
eukprot:1322914-Rhodomonas_salina.2